MEVKFKTFGCFSNPVSSYVNACNLEQDGPGHGNLEERGLVRRKKGCLMLRGLGEGLWCLENEGTS